MNVSILATPLEGFDDLSMDVIPLGEWPCGYCRQCWTNYMGITSMPGHLYHRQNRWARRKRWREMQRIKVEELASSKGSASLDLDAWSKSYPTLWEFLFSSECDDGLPRETGTMNLFHQDGLVKCWLNDRDSGASACLSASSPIALLATVEKALKAATIGWRAPAKRKASKKARD